LLAQWRAWVDQFNPDVVIYMARSDVLNQEVGGCPVPCGTWVTAPSY